MVTMRPVILSIAIVCLAAAPALCLDDFQVMYGTTKCDGQLLTEPETASQPNIAAPSASSTDSFTVLMWDPDAPSPSNPSCRSWLHWIYVDAVGKHLSGGTDVEKYAGPTPPAGTHTYHFTLYRQTQSMAAVAAPSQRCHFDPIAFANEHGLQQVADVTFKVSGPPVGTEAHQGRKRMHRGRRAEARKQEKVGEGMGASIEEWFERMLEKK